MAHSTAWRFSTGSAPGCARQTGQVRVFGSAPHSLAQRQNIFVRVFSCTWISRPMTGSQLIASLPGTKSKPSAVSSAWPTSKRRFSENCGPRICRPTGSPSERPHGIESPGSPAMFGGIVSTSARYMASGFAVFSPKRKATVGEVGLSSTSKSSKAAANSSLIIVRTFWAWP